MAFQIYYLKKGFEFQKFNRFFKERRIQLQEFDLTKHKLGNREIMMFINAFGLESLLDKENSRVREHPACYTNDVEAIVEYIKENPYLIKLPILRNGNKLMLAYDEKRLIEWL